MMLAKEMLLASQQPEAGWTGIVKLHESSRYKTLDLEDFISFGNAPEIRKISLRFGYNWLRVYLASGTEFATGIFYRKDTGSIYKGTSSSEVPEHISGPQMFATSEEGKEVTVYWKPL